MTRCLCWFKKQIGGIIVSLFNFVYLMPPSCFLIQYSDCYCAGIPDFHPRYTVGQDFFLQCGCKCSNAWFWLNSGAGSRLSGQVMHGKTAKELNVIKCTRLLHNPVEVIFGNESDFTIGNVQKYAGLKCPHDGCISQGILLQVRHQLMNANGVN